MNSEFAVAPCDVYWTRLSGIEVIRKAASSNKRSKTEKRKKKIKKRATEN